MHGIEKVTVVEDVTLVTLQNAPANIKFVANIFESLTEAEINVDMISQTPPRGELASISFTMQDDDMPRLLKISNDLRKKETETKLNISSGNCKISVCGEFMREHFGIASKVFRAAASVGTDIRIITTSETVISMLIEKSTVDATVEAIKKAFN